MRPVLFEAAEKGPTVGALFFVVGVDGVFEEADDPKPLPLGSDRTEPAVVRHR
jgi:hypothetical protein